MLSRTIRHTSRGLQGITARGFATSIAVNQSALGKG